MPGAGIQFRNSLEDPARHPVNGTDTLKEGYALCLDFDNTTTGTAPEWDRRVHQAEKPTLQNLPYFLGVVHPTHVGNPTTDVANSVKEFNIIRSGAGKTPGVNVYTNLNCAVGDLLAPMPGSYAFGAPVCHAPVFRTIEAANRSSTAGLVMGEFGIIQPLPGELEAQVMTVFEDWLAVGEPSGTADAQNWKVTGAGTPATSLVDDFQGGALRLTTTNVSGDDCSVQLNGEPFSLASGNQLYFKARMKANSLANSLQFFIGLGVGGTTVAATTAAADYMGFIVAASGSSTDIIFRLRKDSTNTDTAASAIGTLDTSYHVYEFVVDVPGAQVLVYFDGVLKATMTTLTNLPNDELLTPVAEIETLSANACNADLDYILCRGSR